MPVLRTRLREMYQRSLSLPGLRHLRAGQFRRLRPLRDGRFGRGTSIVRLYWSRFLDAHREDVRGRCLEIGETVTIRRFGGDRVTQADALDLAAHSPEVTVVADLSRADDVPADTWDCFVNQFTMPSIYDTEAALYHALRLLKPGGVLLINFACVDYYIHRGLNMGTGDALYIYHQFTPVEVMNYFLRLDLAESDVTMTVYGNLMARMGFLLNLPAEELSREERETRDPGQPLLICVRAVKPEGWNPPKPAYRDPLWHPPGPPARISSTTGHYGDDYLR